MTADVMMSDGARKIQDRGTARGSVMSPLFAEFSQHCAFGKWLERHHLLTVSFERYVDDVICHCESEAKGQSLLIDPQTRMAQC